MMPPSPSKRTMCVRSLYKQLEEPDAWDAYITELRDPTPRLPAFLDELRKAGI